MRSHRVSTVRTHVLVTVLGLFLILNLTQKMQQNQANRGLTSTIHRGLLTLNKNPLYNIQVKNLNGSVKRLKPTSTASMQAPAGTAQQFLRK